MGDASMAAAGNPHDLLFVNSKITAPAIMSVDGFFKWYDDDHIPDVLDTGKVAFAARYVDNDSAPDVERPYLAVYDVDDVSFRTSPEFAKIRMHSPLLPTTGSCFEVADFDVRWYVRKLEYERPGAPPRPGPFLMVVELEPGSEVADDEFVRWYKDEHLGMLSQCDGYRRSRVYKLSHSSQNMRDNADRTVPYPRPWLSLHEWEVAHPNDAQIAAVSSTPWAKKVMANTRFADRMFGLKKEFSLENQSA